MIGPGIDFQTMIYVVKLIELMDGWPLCMVDIGLGFEKRREESSASMVYTIPVVDSRQGIL